MTYTYEVRISLTGADDTETYYVDHRFLDMPTAPVMVELRDEAKRTFSALYGTEPDKCGLSCVYLAASERQVDPTPIAEGVQP